LNNLELNSTYQLTWYYRVDANTNERHLVPNPNAVGLPGTISTTNSNSISAQYTNVTIGRDIPLTDANNLLFYSVAVNKQGNITELTESTKCSWIWSSGNTAIITPIASATLGSNSIITLPIVSGANNTVLLNGSVSQLELNKLYKTEWYVTLPNGSETLITINGVAAGDSFAETSSTSRNLTSVSYVIPPTVGVGQISFRLYVYQNDNKAVKYDSSIIGVVVNPAVAVTVPKPSVNLIVMSTDPSTLTANGGTVYLRAMVDSLLPTENYELTWEILKPNTPSPITLSGLPSTISGKSSDQINTSINTGTLNIGTAVSGRLNIKLTVAQIANRSNNTSSAPDVIIEPAPIATPLNITNISSSVNTFSLDNQSVSTRLSVTVSGVDQLKFYKAVWRYSLPGSNTEYPLGTSNIQISGGGLGDASDVFNISNLGTNTGPLTVKVNVYESINGVLQNTSLASRNIDITLTLPTPSISLSLASIVPANGITTSSTNASVTIDANITKLVANKSYTLSWLARYPTSNSVIPIPGSESTISGVTARTVTKTLQLTDVSNKGDVYFYAKITQVGDTTNTTTEYTTITIGDPNIARPTITGVTLTRQDPNVTGFFVGETNVGINLDASVSNLTNLEEYRYIWEYSTDNTNFIAVLPEEQITGTGVSNSIRLPVSGSINTGNNKSTLTVRLTVTSVAATSRVGRGSTTRSIDIRVPNTPDVNTVTSNITTFTQSTSVSNLNVSANVTNLSANDRYYLKFYYKLPGDAFPRYIGSEKLLTGTNPANIISETSSPVNFTLGAITGVVTVGAEVYNSVTNSIKDIAETTYTITEIGSPVVTIPTSSKTTFTTNESASTTLGSSVSGLTSTETYNVTWEYILNGTTYSVPGGSSTITGQTGQSLSVNLNNVNTGSTVNGTIVFKVTVAHSTNTNKKASQQVSYTIARAAAVGINSMTVGTNTFVKGTTPLQVSLGASLTNLTPGKSYTVKWYYQFSTQAATQWTDLTADNMNIQSTTSQPVTKIVQFTPNIPTAPGSVVFKAVVTQLDDSSNTAEIPSTVIPITATSSGGGNTLNTPNIGSLTSSITDFKLNQSFTTTLSAPVTGLTSGVVYNCYWYYIIDDAISAYRSEVPIGNNVVSSNTATLTTPSITITNRVNNDNTSRKITFKVVIEATGTNTTPLTVSASSKSIEYNVVYVGGGSTPTLSFSNSNPSVTGTTGSSYNGTLMLNVTNVSTGTVINLTNATYNGSSSITHSGTSSYSVTYAGTYPSTAGSSILQITASASGVSQTTATLSITATSGGTSGGTVTISSLTSTNANTFVQGTTTNSPKLTASFTGLTPGTNYALRWYLSYDNGVTPQPVTTLTDDALPTNINAPFTITSTTTTASKNVTLDPIAFNSNTKIRFKVGIVLPNGTEVTGQSAINYDILPATNPTGGLSATLKVNSNTSATVNDKTQLTFTVTINGTTSGSTYEFFNQHKDPNGTTWNVEDLAAAGYYLSDVNGNMITKPVFSATGTTVNATFTAYSRNTTTTSVTKKLSLLVYKTGTTAMTAGVTSSEVTLTIGPKVATISLPTINIGFNTISQNNYEAYWEDEIPVSITASNAIPNTNYDWTVAIAEVGTPANLQAVQEGKWTFGTDLWGTRTTDPMTASRGFVKLNGTTTTYTLDRTVLENAWGLINPIRNANNVEIPFGTFREIQVAILAYAGDVDTLTTIPMLDKVFLSDFVKIKFWQKNNQPTITLHSTGPFNLYWGSSFVIGGNGSNLQNLKVGSSYNYTYAIADITTNNDIQSVRDGKWHFGLNPFLPDLPVDPTSTLVTKGLLSNVQSVYMPIPDETVHSPWSNSVRVADVPLNQYKEIKACIVGHIVTPNLDIDKVVLSPICVVRIWNRPESGPVNDTFNPTVNMGIWEVEAMHQANNGETIDVYWSDTGLVSLNITGARPNTNLYYVIRTMVPGGSYIYQTSLGDPNANADITLVNELPLGMTGADGSLNTGQNNIWIGNPHNANARIPNVSDGGTVNMYFTIMVFEADGTGQGTAPDMTFILHQAAR
jgi:hypothetical protein